MAGGVGLLQSRRHIAIRYQEPDQTVINLVSHEGLHVNVNEFLMFLLHLLLLATVTWNHCHFHWYKLFSKFEIKYEHSFLYQGEN